MGSIKKIHVIMAALGALAPGLPAIGHYLAQPYAGWCMLGGAVCALGAVTLGAVSDSIVKDSSS